MLPGIFKLVVISVAVLIQLPSVLTCLCNGTTPSLLPSILPTALPLPTIISNGSIINHPHPGLPVSNDSYKLATYFVDWAIYGRNFTPQDLPAAKLSHVLYAFANLQSDGSVVPGDSYGDLQKHFPGDSWNDPNASTNAYGCIKQLYILKKNNRQMKVLLSIGGWSWSTNFPAAAATAASRTKFASTAVTLMRDWGFDGIDIDWEYPKINTDDAKNFVLLLATVRQALDDYANKTVPGYKFLLTVASPAGPDNYNVLHMKDMDRYLDSWHLMAYDYAGSWGNYTGHSANLHPSPDNPNSTPFSTNQAIQDYVKAGVTKSKIVLGMPIYGRSFTKTSGMGKNFTTDANGDWGEKGVYDYKTLVGWNAPVQYNKTLGAAWNYNSTEGMVSYDTPQVVQQKVEYIEHQGLGGAVFWESSADAPGDKSLISTASKGLGSLESSQNCLSYPASQYPNIANNMAGK